MLRRKAAANGILRFALGLAEAVVENVRMEEGRIGAGETGRKKGHKYIAVAAGRDRGRQGIVAAAGPGISNGRVESINDKVKAAAGMGYGLGNADNMIALPMLRCPDAKPKLPGRPPKKNEGHRPMKAAA